MKLHVEQQKIHPRNSPRVRCCGISYRWSTDARVNHHEQGDSLVIECIKCKVKHVKFTGKDWEPIE